MTESEKPVILIVHGAWHRPLHYRALINQLKDQGCTVLAPPLASSGYDDSINIKSHLDDVHRIHEVLVPYIDQGREVVVVAHSYGGIPATEAAENLTVVERRAKGLQGGITSFIYIAALVALQRGISLYEATNKEWTTLRYHGVDEFTLPLKLAEASYAFYNDVEDGDVKKYATAYLCGQSRKPFEDPLQYTMQDIKVPKTYVICTDDQAIYSPVQRMIAQAGEAKEVELNCGHSPFLKDAERDMLVKLISKAATEHV